MPLLPAKALNCRFVVFPSPLSPVVMNPKLNQGVTVAAISRFSEPFNSRPEVAVFAICYCNILCGTGVPSMECFSQPEKCFLNVFSDTISIAEQNPQIVLRMTAAVFSGFPDPLSSFCGGTPYDY